MSDVIRGNRTGGDEEFDPVAEGARYRLAPVVASKIWEHVHRDAVDARGRRDLVRARLSETTFVETRIPQSVRGECVHRKAG